MGMAGAASAPRGYGGYGGAIDPRTKGHGPSTPKPAAAPKPAPEPVNVRPATMPTYPGSGPQSFPMFMPYPMPQPAAPSAKPEAPAATPQAQASMPPPMEPGKGWAELSAPGSLNPRLGTRTQRESMQALASAGRLY